MRPVSLLSSAMRRSLFENKLLLVVGTVDETVDALTPPRIRSILSPDEVYRLGQFQDPLSSWQFVAARIIARELLAQLLSVEPREVELRLGASGKPVIDSSMPIELSISHSGPKVAVLIALKGKCGVDIESMDLVPAWLPLSEKLFSEAETTWVSEVADPVQKGRRFLRLWTRKEAYLKATGEGLKGLSDQIGFESLSSSCTKVKVHHPHQREPVGYWVNDVAVADNGYCLAVCLAWQPEKIRPFIVRIGHYRTEI